MCIHIYIYIYIEREICVVSMFMYCYLCHIALREKQRVARRREYGQSSKTNT